VIVCAVVDVSLLPTSPLGDAPSRLVQRQEAQYR
jgi:hypothetical protein